MTKYIINGKEIEKLEPSRFVGSGMGVQRLAMQLNDLLEALDEKKEEKIREPEGKQVSYPRDEKREKMAQDANYKNMPEYGEFWRNVKRSSIEEPKSGTHVGILLGDDEGVENVTYDGKVFHKVSTYPTCKK